MNRSSDENTFYMKVAHNDETNPDTQPVRPARIPHSISSFHHIAWSCPWLIVVPFVCVLVLGSAGRRVRERGTC